MGVQNSPTNALLLTNILWQRVAMALLHLLGTIYLLGQSTPAPQLPTAPLAATEQSQTQAPFIYDLNQQPNLQEALQASQQALQATSRLLKIMQQSLPEAASTAAPELADPNQQQNLPLNITLSLQGIANYAAVTAISGKAGFEINWYPYPSWDISSQLQIAYGETRNKQASPVPTAANASLLLRVDRTFNRWVGLYILSGALTDRIAQIAYNIYGELGGSVHWWNVTSENDGLPSLLQTDLGLRTFYEYQREFYPIPREVSKPITTIAPTLTISFQHELQPNTYAKQDIVLYFNALTGDDLRITSTSTIGIGIGKLFTWLITANIRSFSNPIGDSVSPLVDLGTGLQLTL